ncbi:hypothetical protein KSF_107920 [Reticulibacter mediterranei]|uniref:Uncharacterized protein n=1 Tax=Reticulibacter mediterranei TaxID=2778369 RepID=A0A8J3IZB9_9CHLR|nr:hypothetical protein [Reticulibacter mediterranei]GHP00745.1 hypothetical protein KSF_107920 [Reticulibacter mediterranei]
MLRTISVKKMLAIALLTVTLLLCVGSCAIGAIFIGSYNTLQGKENALTTEYLNMSQSLTDYFAKTKNALGVADRNADKLRDIFNAAMGSSGKDADFHNPNNVIYQKIQAAYPNVGNVTNAYEKVQSILISSYDDYSHSTKLLRDHVREYRSFIGSVPNSIVASLLGFPSDRLEVTVNNQTYHGNAALKQMEKVIQDNSAANSINTGTLQPIFETPTPTTPHH